MLHPLLFGIIFKAGPIFGILYPSISLLYQFYNPQNKFLLSKVEWGPAKSFGTQPFFFHKSATKRSPRNNKNYYLMWQTQREDGTPMGALSPASDLGCRFFVKYTYIFFVL